VNAVQVTREHIQAGIREDCAMCPVALALVAAGFRNPDVDQDRFTADVPDGFLPGDSFDVDWGEVRGTWGHDIRSMILAFDRTGRLEPFAFDVDTGERIILEREGEEPPK